MPTIDEEIEMTDILELAKRVEALGGPCRETDEAICDALFTERQRTCIKGLSDADGGMNMWRYPNGHIANALRFTGSLDAAMTLVPEGWLVVHLSELGGAGGCICKLGNPGTSQEALSDSGARTMPFALVAAALRAKDATNEQ